MTRALLFALALLAAQVVAGDDAPEPTRLGQGDHTYEVVAWPKMPAGELGSTHGGIAIARDGRVYLSTDTERTIMVFEPDGTLVEHWGKDFGGSIHQLLLREEEGVEYLYLCYLRNEIIKTTLAGEIVWRLGTPEESELYDLTGDVVRYHPTSVAIAPDGRIFAADGYGLKWIHRYSADREYLGSLGGPGKEAGKLAGPHGIHVDTRQDPPVLLVADRDNNRLQTFTLEGEHIAVYEGAVRRPCSFHQRGDELVVADLDGRVTILDRDYEAVAHLGDNPDQTQWSNFDVPVEQWRDGIFNAPHFAAWDAAGNLYVMDWNRYGRVSKLRRVPAEDGSVDRSGDDR